MYMLQRALVLKEMMFFNPDSTVLTDKLSSSHGRKLWGVGGGDEAPRDWTEWTLMQIVSPDFIMFQNFKHQIVSITVQ